MGLHYSHTFSFLFHYTISKQIPHRPPKNASIECYFQQSCLCYTIWVILIICLTFFHFKAHFFPLSNLMMLPSPSHSFPICLFMDHYPLFHQHLLSPWRGLSWCESLSWWMGFFSLFVKCWLPLRAANFFVATWSKEVRLPVLLLISF